MSASSDARIRSARTLAVFLSFDDELDTRPLIDVLWAAGKQVICRYCILSPQSLAVYALYRHHAAGVEPVAHPPSRLNITTLLPLAGREVLFTALVAFEEQGAAPVGMGWLL